MMSYAYVKVGFQGVFIVGTCFPDVLVAKETSNLTISVDFHAFRGQFNRS